MWFWIVLIVIVVLSIIGKVVGERNFKTTHKVPKSFETLDYTAGLNDVPVGKVYAWSEDGSLVLLSRKAGKRKNIRLDRVVGVHLNSDVQSVNTGGGRSIGGALAGGAVAGPVGAIVGSRKKTKVKEFDHSTVQLVVKNDRDQDVGILFKGGNTTYTTLMNITGVSV